MNPYTTVLGESTFEYEDRKSVFIGAAAPVSTEIEALAFIESQRKRYPDAKHHVYAYVLKDNSIMRFSDDREPQGTAGLPVLDAIRKNGCTDVVITVIRYFGGTLLGTGGLVRAYTAAALGALQGAGIAKYDVYSSFELVVSYSDHQRLTPLFAEFDFRTEDIIYSDEVLIVGRVLKIKEEEFLEKVVHATSGRIKLKKNGEKFDF